MLSLRSPKSLADILLLCKQVDETYGEQYHPKADLLLHISEMWPSLIVMAFKNDELIGHTFLLPLSDSGRTFFFDPDAPESDLSSDHLSLSPDKSKRTHFFVYSILSKEKRHAFTMIKTLMNGVGENVPFCHPESTLLAEIVTPEGKSLATKLGLKFFHSYFFESDEEVFLYDNCASDSVKVFSKYTPSLNKLVVDSIKTDINSFLSSK